MGVLNFETEQYHLRRVTAALQRRGMIPDLEEDWEIHGPHEGMNFQVYVGYAISLADPQDTPCVAIYPKAVYEIEDPSAWGGVMPDQRIPIEGSTSPHLLRAIVDVYFSSRDYTVTLRLECGHEYVYECGTKMEMDWRYQHELKREHTRMRCKQCEAI